ncbi:hypothetical protein GYH30_031563 [Glycine max]|nr:hypothetical protein GYH30_031563 [Glycine max]
MENRSFDHVLSWLKSSRLDIVDLTDIDVDPGYSFQAIHEQMQPCLPSMLCPQREARATKTKQ